MKKIIGIILLLILIFNIPAFAVDGKKEYNPVVTENSPNNINDIEKDIMEEVNLIKEELAEEYENIEKGNPITIGDREYVSEGWQSVNYTHQLSSNNAYIIISEGEDYRIKITSSNNDEWKIVATGTMPGEGVEFIIYYQMSEHGRTGIYRVTVIITGDGSVPIREGFTGTGNYKIQGVKVLQYTILGAPGDNGNGTIVTPPDNETNETIVLPDNETNETIVLPDNETNETVIIPPNGNDNETFVVDPDDDYKTLVIIPDDGSSKPKVIIPNNNGSAKVSVVGGTSQEDTQNNMQTTNMENTGVPIPLLVILIIVALIAVRLLKK